MDLVALAPEGLESVLEQEVSDRLLRQHERLFVLKGSQIPIWADNVWLEPKTFNFNSISEAADHLRSIQRNWWLHSVAKHRRAELIQQKLPPLKKKEIEFLSEVPASPMGSWTLLDENTLLYSAKCTSPFGDGEWNFKEDKINPPSRAYLKLWEFFTRTGVRPQEGERCLDLGSSPGGWTWVLDQMETRVLSVDKALLAENLKLSERVEYKSESAFGLDPKCIGPVDWLFSDIICYPDRLLNLVQKWMPFTKNFVCTIKFQGPTDFSSIQKFLEIPGSQVVHLFNNKHELTWWKT